MSSRSGNTVAAAALYSVAVVLSLLGFYLFLQYLFFPQGTVVTRIHDHSGWPAVACVLVLFMPLFVFGARALARPANRRR